MKIIPEIEGSAKILEGCILNAPKLSIRQSEVFIVGIFNVKSRNLATINDLHAYFAFIRQIFNDIFC